MKNVSYRKIYWEAAEWTIERVDDPILQTEYLADTKQGQITDSQHSLSFRYANNDQAIKCILHEVIHKMFWEEDDEEKIKRAEIVLKSFLDAMGVDLSPLLRGYNKLT